MTSPLRTRAASPTSAVQPFAETAGPPPAQSTGAMPELGRAPALPASTGRGQLSAARRRRLPAHARPGSTDAAGPSSSAPAPHTPSAQLTRLAQHLAGLEQERAKLSTRIGEAVEARLAAGRAAGPQHRRELRKLQDRVHQASATLQGLMAARAAHLDQLERAERQLASCVRSLRALSLAASTSSGSGAVTVALPRAGTVASSTPVAIAPSPQETEVLKLVGQLEQQQQAVAIERKRIDKQLDAARTKVADLKSAVEFALDPANFLPGVNDCALDALDRYLKGINLPALSRVPGRRAQDTRYARYLEYFTEVGENGAPRLTRAVREAPRASFAAFSALTGSMMPGMRLNSFLRTLLDGNLDGIKAALGAGGQGLEEAVEEKITASFQDFVESTRSLVDSASVRPPESSRGRQRRRFDDTHVSRATRDEAIVRNGHLVSLQAMPEHRSIIIEQAVSQTCSMMRDLVAQCNDDNAQLAEAQARFNDAEHAQGPMDERAKKVAQQLDAAREQRNALASERRRREAAQATSAPRPIDATIPQTRTPVSSSDPEANRLKLRGNSVVHIETIHGAKEQITHADQEIRVAAATLRGCEAELEKTAAAYAREVDGARRQHGEYREELTGLRRDLHDLDARINQAREGMGSDPARQAMVSDRAWARAVERHVEPDHTALRDRARITGYAGVYASQADLGRAVVDIHAHLAQQPDFRALLNARTVDEFERAATQLPDGVIDRVYDHGRPVGRGFSNRPDQTAHPTELTKSCYSLQFVQGRVLVSHIYPQVPPLQLQTAR